MKQKTNTRRPATVSSSDKENFFSALPQHPKERSHSRLNSHNHHHHTSQHQNQNTLEKHAKEKLNTYSELQEDIEIVRLGHDHDQFTGWVNEDNILLEQRHQNQARGYRKRSLNVSRDQSVKKQAPPSNQNNYLSDNSENNASGCLIGVNATRMALEYRSSTAQKGPSSTIDDEECLDLQSKIYLLKKEAQYLQSDDDEQPPSKFIPRGKSRRFPKGTDILDLPSRIRLLTDQLSNSQHPSMTLNNFFRSKEKVSTIEENRKRIKGLARLGSKFSNKFNTGSLLLSPPDYQVLLKETQFSVLQSRPLTSVPKPSSAARHNRNDENMESSCQTLNGSAASSINHSTKKSLNYANYIPSSFKRCRMYKRNKSARLNAGEEDTAGVAAMQEYKEIIKGSKIMRQKQYRHTQNEPTLTVEDSGKQRY